MGGRFPQAGPEAHEAARIHIQDRLRQAQLKKKSLQFLVALLPLFHSARNPSMTCNLQWRAMPDCAKDRRLSSVKALHAAAQSPWTSRVWEF
jgi:hypothetical protein